MSEPMSGEPHRLSATNSLSKPDGGARAIDLMSVREPTIDPKERRSRDDNLAREMKNILLARLPPGEAELWQGVVSGAVDPQRIAHLMDKFDDVLIEQAESLGWRVLESAIVLERYTHWMYRDPRGLEKLHRFHESLERHAKISRGLERHLFREPEWYQTRKNALKELKNLQRKMVSQFASRNRIPNPIEASSTIRAEIEALPSTYKYLTANFRSFSEYARPLTPRFVTGGITPGAILDGWFDHQGNTAPGKSRQIISRIGSRKKK